MDTPVLIFVDAAGITEHVQETLYDNDAGSMTAHSVFVEFVDKVASRYNADIAVCADVNPLVEYPWPTECREHWYEQDMISLMSQRAADLPRYGSILLLRADSPLYIFDETCALIEQHQKYFAHYSFCDGYPAGATPELFSVEALPMLHALASPDTRFSNLFAVIQQDINAFDIETRIAPQDFRLLRLVLRADSRRNTLLCRRLAERLDVKNTRWFSKDELITVLDQADLDFRTLPASLNWILHSTVSRPAVYYPNSTPHSGSQYELVVDAVQSVVEWTGDLVLTLSHLGEPSEYAGIYDLIAQCASIPGVRVVVETDGIGWQYDQLKDLAGLHDQIDWILFLDSVDPALYQQIRPDGNFDAAITATEDFLQLFPDSTYIQAVRMDISESHMLDFYRFWQEKTGHVIIQKYNSYSGALPEHRPADTSPIRRMPCWRLKREMTVMPDGGVAMCHVDVIDPSIAGNIFRQSPDAIWDSFFSLYRQHVDGRYPALCVNCDEYYTFTF